MRYDVVTVVASRRGLAELRQLVANLPTQFGVPIVCLAESHARLIADLAEMTALKVEWAQHGGQLLPGRLYLSPPGTSIVFLEDRSVSLAPFGAESMALHPVDTFLTSAARAFGPRALGVMLAGFHDDGAAGAHALKWKGGTMLVLDRATSEYFGMADAIVKAGSYDRILTAEEVANALRASFTGRDLLESAELQFELGQLLDSALRLSGTHMGNVRLLEPVANLLHVVASRGFHKDFIDAVGVVRADEGASECARAMRLRARIAIEDVFKDPLYSPYYDLARKAGYRSVQSTPILGEAGVSGMLSTHFPYPHVVSAHEARTLDELAREAETLVRGEAGR